MGSESEEGLEDQAVCPEKTVNKAVKVKPKMQCRSQEVGEPVNMCETPEES